MKLKDVENKMNMLEKIVRDGQNYGRDDRMGRASSAFRMYNTYNADLDDEAEDIVSKGNKLLGKFLDLKDKFSEVAVRYAQVNSQYIYLLFEQIAGQKKSMDRL